MHPKAKFALFIILALVSLVAAILACFMITDKSTNKMEYYWWVFLMCTTWIAFGGSAIAAGVSGASAFKPIPSVSDMKNLASDAMNTAAAVAMSAAPQMPMMPPQMPMGPPPMGPPPPY